MNHSYYYYTRIISSILILILIVILLLLLLLYQFSCSAIFECIFIGPIEIDTTERTDIFGVCECRSNGNIVVVVVDVVGFFIHSQSDGIGFLCACVGYMRVFSVSANIFFLFLSQSHALAFSLSVAISLFIAFA